MAWVPAATDRLRGCLRASCAALVLLAAVPRAAAAPPPPPRDAVDAEFERHLANGKLDLDGRSFGSAAEQFALAWRSLPRGERYGDRGIDAFRRALAAYSKLDADWQADPDLAAAETALLEEFLEGAERHGVSTTLLEDLRHRRAEILEPGSPGSDPYEEADPRIARVGDPAYDPFYGEGFIEVVDNDRERSQAAIVLGFIAAAVAGVIAGFLPPRPSRPWRLVLRIALSGLGALLLADYLAWWVEWDWHGNPLRAVAAVVVAVLATLLMVAAVGSIHRRLSRPPNSRLEPEHERTTVFVSYAREDEDAAQRLAKGLTDEGLAVWWDRRMLPGDDFDRVIDEALASAGCVVVLWSKASVRSHFVKAEAREGHERALLVPAIIDDVDPSSIPLEFRGLHAVRLHPRRSLAGQRDFQALVRAIRRRLGEKEAQPQALGG